MLLGTVQWQREHRVHTDLDAATARIYGATNVASTYREIFKAIDVFMVLRFTVTEALPAAKRTRILSMTQHARRPITFGMKENN
jgi:hypothetical protein